MRSCREKERISEMNDDVDIVLARRVQECALGKHLPSDFSDRLIRSVRHHRRVSRIKIAISLIVICVLGMGFVGLVTAEAPKQSSEVAIKAYGVPLKSEQVSGWVFLGFIRECFKRNKSNKKKEEE